MCIPLSFFDRKLLKRVLHFFQMFITLEFLSSFDTKEAVAKAANILLQKYLKSKNLWTKRKKITLFTEAHLPEALTDLGLFAINSQMGLFK